MVKIYKHFWHPHESDEYPDYDLSKISWRARRRGFQGNLMVSKCSECQEPVVDNLGSDCGLCDEEWHLGCIPSSPDDINHPYHPYHPLKLLIDGPPDYSNGKCDVCQKTLNNFFYHCSMCDFSMHSRCSKDPPSLIVDVPKCHEHTLTLMARNDTFTCNACGTHGEKCPYVCPPCSLMFHMECIKLPHVININRHDHRISHTYSLGFGDWKCLICQKKIDWRYGAYSCLICPSYAVHSKCATRDDVWDGIELEGVPEEYFDVSPFKEITVGVINHFSHEEHNLKIVEDAIELDGSTVRCKACIQPIFSDTHYTCMECSFVLHKTCANLPRRKRHGLCTKPLTLISTTEEDDTNKDCFVCDACGILSNGFRYESGEVQLDMLCVSISSYIGSSECHPHTLFLTTLEEGTCSGCHVEDVYVLNCVECKFLLCFKCATLPKKIRHRCDDHFLLLRYGEKEKGKYWCEVCETVLDQQNWFYTCDNSGVVCHIDCVLGEFWKAKPGVLENELGNGGRKVQVVSNDGMSRPICMLCHSHCQRPLIILKLMESDPMSFFCNVQCFNRYIMR